MVVGDTMAEILIAVVGEVRHKENKGHLSGPLVALSLPRSAGDAGISLIVDHGGMEKAKGDPRIVRMFRVRRDHVHRVLELLLRHNKYYRSLYREIDEEALNRPSFGRYPGRSTYPHRRPCRWREAPRGGSCRGGMEDLPLTSQY